MKKLIQTEEALMFAATLYAFSYFGMSWWWFIAFILLPDIGMVGYIFNARVGAYSYDVFHHRGVAVLVALAGLMTGSVMVQFISFILFSHSCMDRMLGYGLKDERGFRYTHLGEVGKK